MPYAAAAIGILKVYAQIASMDSSVMPDSQLHHFTSITLWVNSAVVWQKTKPIL